MLGDVGIDARLNIAEIRKPELDAQLVAEGIAQQIDGSRDVSVVQ